MWDAQLTESNFQTRPRKSKVHQP
ncbi:MAG: hypothetical protein ACLTXU_25115 [Enterocloster bolteae]